MSDIRMQSIFLDEEFVYIQEDKSDVDWYNSRTQSRARAKSQGGHDPKKGILGGGDIKRTESNRGMNSRLKSNEIQRAYGKDDRYGHSYFNTKAQKIQSDAYNKNNTKNQEKYEKSRPASHKGQAASRVKKESAIMDMIEII